MRPTNLRVLCPLRKGRFERTIRYVEAETLRLASELRSHGLRMSFDEERPLSDIAVGTAPGEDAVLRCKACGLPVAFERDAIEVLGKHVHRFVNPAGEAFEVGCFREASGCAPWGPAETFWTWFPGRAWRVALCARCGIHLGWSYEGEGSAFHALIMPRLAR